MSTENSKKAYIQIVNELPRLQSVVFNSIKSIDHKRRSIPEIESKTNLQYSTVTGRLTELQDKGLIIDSGLSWKGCTVWEISNPMKRECIINERRKGKFISDVRNFLKKYRDELDHHTVTILDAY